MLRPLAITTLTLAAVCGVARADVYRWVDEKGEAHYSDRWVPGSEVIKSSKPRPMTPESNQAPGPTAAKPAATAAENATAKLQQEQAQAAVKQDVAKAKEAQCKQAKERYQQAIEARRLYKPPKEGDTDRVFMNDQETDAYRLQARNDVISACGSPPAPVQPE